MRLNRNRSDWLNESGAAESKLEHFITHKKNHSSTVKMNFTCKGIHFSLTKKNCLSFRVRDLICKQSVEVHPGLQEVIWASCYLTTTKRQHSSAAFFLSFSCKSSPNLSDIVILLPPEQALETEVTEIPYHDYLGFIVSNPHTYACMCGCSDCAAGK